jgi:hypothetical protein
MQDLKHAQNPKRKTIVSLARYVAERQKRRKKKKQEENTHETHVTNLVGCIVFY